ncbi:MAG: lipocalin-like domain-containing protein [Acidobacteriia bacterium]|nr:lipocalin-like domain-containing protein [Terriglobia bacterium]
MRHHMRLIIAGLLLSSAIVLGAEPPGRLVGTWQLVSRVDRDLGGKIVPDPSLGPDPIGYLIYDGSGHVAVQLMGRHRSSDPCQVTAPAEANNLAHVGGYDAYFGRYEVDHAASTVTHILEGALSQADVGRSLVRRFKLDGDTLAIEFEPGAKGRTRTLTWRRVSP